ncbi:hypothetical protein [Streptomyces sp. NPDC048419]|uniref:hypothetical protein n=1 Tax=Streptomyces sp. NPDC048419 TaxID=3365547 RepID=UPI00371D16B8
MPGQPWPARPAVGVRWQQAHRPWLVEQVQFGGHGARVRYGHQVVLAEPTEIGAPVHDRDDLPQIQHQSDPRSAQLQHLDAGVV